MKRIRLLISAFVAVLFAVLLRGWVWTAGHQTAAQAAASHVVLSLGLAAGVIGLYAIWRPARPLRGNER